jgi:hypothetical protein
MTDTLLKTGVENTREKLYILGLNILQRTNYVVITAVWKKQELAQTIKETGLSLYVPNV